MPVVKYYKHATDGFNDNLDYIKLPLQKNALGVYSAHLHYKNNKKVVIHYVSQKEVDKFDAWVQNGIWVNFTPPFCPILTK